MFGIIRERLQQKKRTLDYPAKEPFLPPLFKGKPELDRCGNASCRLCLESCPTKALQKNAQGIASLDLGRCTFCGACANACPDKAIRFTREYRLHTFSREELIIQAGEKTEYPEPEPVPAKARIFGKSLQFRVVSAGGCGACEADTNVLGTLLYDLGRFGIAFAASPRHADGILITGPVTKNMERALLDTYAAIPTPKLVVALGSCAISGGLFTDSPLCPGIPDSLHVDCFIPGCPPNPWTSLAALLALQKRFS